MELKMPTAEQAHWGLRAMKTVALADGALDDAERHMLASVQTILGTIMRSKNLAARHAGGAGLCIDRPADQASIGTRVDRGIADRREGQRA